MRPETLHLTDSELVMLADGELSQRASGDARLHLDSCWTCRERMRSHEESIANFVRERNRELSGAVGSPAGSRAILRARMAEMVAKETPAGSAGRGAGRSLFARVGAAAACLAALAGTLAVFELRVNAEGSRPNARVTPGETRPITLAEVCSSARAEVVVRHISFETKRRVLATYGVTAGNPDDYEVDYLITPDLGGAETVRNLWPQPYSSRWNAKMKDELEQRLHDMVCAGNLDLRTAQSEIASDWIGAYKRYVHPGVKP